MSNDLKIFFNSINTIVTDREGNIRIYRLPSGRGTDHEIDISLASGKSIHGFWTGLYQQLSLYRGIV
jgi:hypothetical protein